MNINCIKQMTLHNNDGIDLPLVIDVYVRLHNGNGSLVQLRANACVEELVTAVRETDL